jgi:hypothetical protein
MRAQDTIYIYEEEIIYDTVYEYVQRRVNPFEGASAIQNIRPSALSTNPNLLIFSRQAYTHPAINEWKEPTDSAHRNRIFGFIVDRSTLDMFMGIGGWTSICNPLVVEGHLAWNDDASGTISFGVNYETQFISRLTLGTGASIHFLLENESLKGKFTCNYPDCEYCSGDSKFTVNIGTFNFEKGEEGHGEGLDMHWDEDENGHYQDSVGLKEAETNYILFAVPMRLGFRAGKFTPYLGAEYNIRMARENDLKDLHSLGIITGIRYDFGKHFAVSSNFYAALTKDMTHTGALYSRADGTHIRTDKYTWHTLRFELMGHFKF